MSEGKEKYKQVKMEVHRFLQRRTMHIIPAKENDYKQFPETVEEVGKSA